MMCARFANTRRTIGALVLALTTVSLSLGIGALPAQAQEATPVVGTADFRSPPQLLEGSYEDTIVSGETVWYTVMYRNDTPYRFDVSLPDSSETLPIGVRLVRPNLVPESGPSSSLESGGTSHAASHTNLWYLAVSFDSSVAEGVAHRVRINIEGVEDTRLVDCPQTDDCTLDQELAQVVGELADVEDALAEYDGVESASAVAVEIQNIQGFLDTADTVRPQAESRLASAQNLVAQLCAPETICDAPTQGSATPTWAMALGLLALAGGGTKAFKRLRSVPEEAEPPPGARAVFKGAPLT